MAEDEQIFYGVEVEKFVEFGMFVFGANWGEDVFWLIDVEAEWLIGGDSFDSG